MQKKMILALFILTQCVVNAFDDLDMPRFFTNGHGGYQFFHADENNHKIADRRIDNEASYSDSIKYIVKPPEPEPKLHQSAPPPQPSQLSVPKESKTEIITKVTSAPSVPQPQPPKTPQASKLISHRLMPKLKLSNKILSDKSEDLSSENRILKDVTTPKPKHRMRFTTPAFKVTRKRIVVRKFKPQAKTPATEKNKKREISSATGNGLGGSHSKIPHKYKFTNRNFKPRQVKKPKNNASTAHLNRGALFTRKPSDTFMQLHFRKLDVTTSTTTASSMQGMKEKRHLANLRFFNRRKLRS